MTEEVPFFLRYNFAFEDGHKVVFEVNLDPETLEYIPSDSHEIPYWTRFEYLSCEECIGQHEEIDYCPIAVNIADLVDTFNDVYSYDMVDVKVETRDRVYFKEDLSVQEGVSSLLGVIMVTSGCEDLDKLRPMVRFHLPFATIEETIYRAVSMYLIAQYLRKEKGAEPDWDMKGLIDIYERIDQINANLCKRLQIASEKDASLNAIVVLDAFAQMVSMSIEDTLADFGHLFSAYECNDRDQRKP